MASSSSRRPLLVGLGALFIMAGLAAAAVLWTSAGSRERDAVEGFARAPVGCDTTLDFVETGSYYVFLESSGTVDSVDGDCDVEGDYDVAGSRTPDVEVEIQDPDGDDLSDDLDDDVGDVAYDVEVDGANFVGESIFTIEIEQFNDHVIRVASDDVDETFVVALGRDPGDGVVALRGGAVAAGLVGLLAGVALVLLGVRRRTSTVATDSWNPGSPPAGPVSYGQAGTPLQGPPVYGQQSGPPTYVPGQQQFPPGQPPPPQNPGDAGPVIHGAGPMPYGQQSPSQPPSPPPGQSAPSVLPQPPPSPAPDQPVVPGQPWAPGPGEDRRAEADEFDRVHDDDVTRKRPDWPPAPPN